MSDSNTNTPADIRFQAFAVVNKATGTKARVWYSLDNRCDGRKSVNITDRDYGHALGEVFEGTDVAYRNETDSMTDYFDKGRITIFETSSLYVEARKAVEAILAKQDAKREAKIARREAARRVVIRGIPAVLS